jgi:site-specific DNA recombinase
MTLEHGRIPVAVYSRVSSDDQRDRETIQTQREAAERFLAQHPEYVVYRSYEDDGVSGTIPMAQRPQGRLMVADARAGRFQKVVVYRASRLGREEEDLFAVYNLFVESLGIELVGIMELLNDRMVFGFQSIMSAHYRRQFLADSARGMDRAAREGRYTGGIVPLGYRVEGRKEHARLIPDDTVIWGDWTAPDLVRRIYYRLGVDGKSCRRIAVELNAMGVPTSYRREGRGVRGQTTQGLWRPGRIRNLVVNPVYKGVLLYGRRRSKKSKRTQVIEAEVPVPSLVSADLWDAAQGTLASNRLLAKNTERVYLLRGVMKCGLCGLAFCGAAGRKGVWWYRCNGYLAERGGKDKRCQAKSIRNTDIEHIVWQDIETLLRNPGELLERLRAEMEDRGDDAAALAEAERITLKAALSDLDGRRRRALDMFEMGRIAVHELDERLNQIDDDRRKVAARLDALAVPEPNQESVPEDLLAAIRARLDAGLTDEERSEIVRLLVSRITVHTTVQDSRKKVVRLVIEYRFRPPGCSPTRNGTGSLPRRA